MSASTVDVSLPNIFLGMGTAELPVPVGGEPETAILGPINGRYDLGPKIARGGMGVVYRAQDRLLNRTVAVKVMRGKFLARPDFMRRFLAEARISGRLQHPGIVPVYEVGTLPDGRPFIAMKLIEGETLARLLAARSSTADHLNPCLKVFEALCQAVAYAHQEGVIHRDLKPDNVMVGSFGEVQVMDWGLAKVLGATGSESDMPTPPAPWPTPVSRAEFLSADSAPVGEHATHATAIVAIGPEGPDGARTDAGAVFGTAPFMPPEQARGELDKLDTRADVFSLGAILCQILTGQPPYYGAYETVKENAREGRLFGAYVMLDRCGADPAIVLLAKHCLAVNPADRPADAGVLAAMVTRCLEGLADRAKAMELGRLAAESQLYDLKAQERLTRRARTLARGLAATAAVIASLLTAGLWWYANDRDAREAAEAQRVATAVTGVETALTEANTHIEAARHAPGGPFARDAAARQAAVTWQKANTLAETLPGVPDAVRERLDETKTRVEEAERGTRLAVALERWRTDVIDPKGVFDPPGAARKCAETLIAHGFDVRAMSPEGAAKALAEHPAGPSIREVLADWLAVTEAADERDHLVEVLKATGDGPPPAWLAALSAADPVALANVSADAIPAAGVAVAARRLTQAGSTDAAERLLGRGVRKYTDNFTLNAQLGTLLRARPGRRLDAIRYLTVAAAARPTDPAVGYELGSALADDGRTEDAIELLVRVVEAEPNHAAAHVRLGDLFAATDEDEAAEREYHAAAAADPNYAPAQVRLGERALAANDLDAAETAFRTAAKSVPGDVKVRAALGRLLMKKGDAAGALPEFRAAIASDPKDVTSRFGLAEALRKTGDPAGAIEQARAAAAAAPTDGAAHHALGRLLREIGDHPRALSAFEDASRCTSPPADTFRQIGELHELAQDYRAAAEAYARAVEASGKDEYVLTALARTQEGAGRPADALKTYRRLLEQTSDATVRHNVGRLAVLGGDEAGLADLEAAAAALPDSIDVKTDLGSARLRFGRFRAAAATLREVKESLPADHKRATEIADAARLAMRLAALEARLPDILSGTVTPSSPAGWAEAGEVARRTNRYAAAAACYIHAAKRAEYRAAAAAVLALAASGRGSDAASATPAQRAAWRAEALRLFKELPPEARTDPAFEGLSDQAAWRR
jgi:eukaryotic-like serine/threonine-protein kinase